MENTLISLGHSGAIDPISDLLNTDTSSRIRQGKFTKYIEAKLCFNEAYDSLLGLNTGGSLAEVPEQEKIVAESYMEHRAYEYAKFRIKEMWGIDFVQWLNLPRFVMASLRRVAEKFSADELAAAEAAKRAAAEATKNK